MSGVYFVDLDNSGIFDWLILALIVAVFHEIISKSIAARGKMGIHSTAGFIDPGFVGQVTLELSNVANLPISIYPHMKIGQISFYQMSTPADVPYGSPELGSKYQGQRGPTASQMHRDFGTDG